MARIGMTPLKRMGVARKARDVTLTTVVYLPELSGYWEQGLDILRICLGSMVRTAGAEADVMVFDNGSCDEVRDFLNDWRARGHIQYLLFSDANLGKAAAVNFMFRAAPGKIVAFTDADVLFHPGWLEESRRILDAFGKVGMVSGRPWRPVSEEEAAYMQDTTGRLEEQAGVTLEQGDLVPGDILEEHARSIGSVLPDWEQLGFDDVRATKDGVSAFTFGSHFQYVTTRDAIRDVGELGEGETAISLEESKWDSEMARKGYLRMALTEAYVRHLGNSLDGEDLDELRRLSAVEDAPASTVLPGKQDRLADLLRLFTRVTLFRRIMHRLQVSLFNALFRKAG